VFLQYLLTCVTFSNIQALQEGGRVIGLLYETERCLDGLTLDADGFVRPNSERREPVRLVTADLADPMVIRFTNAGEKLLTFMSQCSAGNIFTPDGEPHNIHIDGIAHWQKLQRQYLIDAGGPKPIDALIPLSLPFIPLKSTLRLYNGKPQLMLQCDGLFDFMRMETALIALEGAKVVICDHCKNIFLAGPGTGRRPHAVHCSDKCRVGATRARKMEG
jgi:hypothetical protein